MKRSKTVGSRPMNRRGFLRGGVIAAGTAAVATHMPNVTLSAEGRWITQGDIAILRFLAAAELLETDLWQQYAELGGPTRRNQVIAQRWKSLTRICRSTSPTTRMMSSVTPPS